MLLMTSNTSMLTSPEMIWLVATIIVGFILWTAGGWLLRSAVGTLGFGLGALGGLFVWLETGIGAAWVAPLLGAVIMACVALLAYRLLAGVMLATLLALICSTTAWAVLHLSESNVPSPPVAELFGISSEFEADPRMVPVRMQSPEAVPTPEWPAEARWASLESAWTQLQPDARLTVLAAGGAAALMGLVISTLFSSLSAMLLTSIAGAGLILGAGPRLLSIFETVPAWLAGSSGETGITLAWASLAALGLILQGCTRPKGESQSSKSS